MDASEDRAWGKTAKDEVDPAAGVPLLSSSPDPSSSADAAATAEERKQEGPEGCLEPLSEPGIPALYTASVADVILRATAAGLTLAELILMVMSREDFSKQKQRVMSPVLFYLSGYTISMNVVVFLYSFAMLSFTIFQLIIGETLHSRNLVFLLSIFQLDQTFAYLLISSSLNAFLCIGNLQCGNVTGFKDPFCERVLASAVGNSLIFVTIAIGSVVSGCRVIAKIRSLSPTSHIAKCVSLDGDGNESESLAAKLLP